MNSSLQLAGWDSARSNFFELRPLAPHEAEFDARSRPVFAEARGRFKLFQILELNYRDWTAYHRALLTPGSRKQDDLLVLDRLLFNFLAAAYGVFEHFEVSYRRRHRKNPARLAEYDAFLEKFFDNSWAAAFFMDFRNYAQHFDLPIGSFNRNEGTHSITISITHDAAKLSADYRDWKRSKLTPELGEIDLITMSEEFYHRLQRDYGGFMAKCFYPELKEMDQFYWQLTQEVRERNPKARMVFLAEKDEKRERTKISVKWSFEQPPNAVFDELGISIER